MAKRKLPKVSGSISQPVLEQELGIVNIMPASSWALWAGNVPDGISAVGRDPLAPSRDELVLMLRRDGQAQAMLKLLTLPIHAAFVKSSWVGPDGETEGPEVDFANQMWTLPPTAGGMRSSSSMFLRQTMLAMPYGFSPFEIVKAYRDSGPLQGKYVIDKMGYRDPRTVTFLADDHGDFYGFKQKAWWNNRYIDVVVEKENAWYWAANEEHNPMYGVSYFEPAFQHYQMKRKLYYIGHLAAQLAAVPGRLGKIPLGASPRQITEFKKGLAELHFAQAMLLPPNFEVEPFNGNSTFDITKIIDHHNTQMAKSLLMGFLQQDDRMVLIDNGKADASADMFIQLLSSVTSELSESWSNKLMPQFIDYNFASGVYPRHKFAELTDADKQAIYDIFNIIVGLANINCTPEFVRSTEMKLADRLGYGIDYNKIADEEEKIAAEQQAQAAEEAKQQAAQAAAQVEATKAAAKPQGPQGANAKQQGKPSPAPTLQGGRPPTATRQPTLKASAKQQQAMETIALALNELIDPEDVPEDFVQENVDPFYEEVLEEGTEA